MQPNQLPGLLSDKQIKELCAPPTFAVLRYDDPEWEYSWKDSLTLGRQVNTSGIKEFRHLTNEEREAFKPMIKPFFPHQIKTRNVVHSATDDRASDRYETQKIVSYGLSSAGYDVRLGRKFKIFTNIRSALIDPLNMSDDCYVNHEGDDVIIPPHSYILGHTPEVFDIPRDVMVVCVGKSTYARAGCAVNVTPIEPGFKGQVVIEIANQTPLPMKVYADMGIAQFLFFKMSGPCETSYADRDGKYQGQTGITTARV
jgi:dCTP deaminase